MEKSMVLILLIICHITTIIVVAQHSVPFPSKGGDSCNVVQVNCGSVAPVDNKRDSQHLRRSGPPGKLGPKGDPGGTGPVGPQGIKGAKGDAPDYVRIQNIMRQTSCKELNEIHRVSTTGYYPLRTIGTGVLVSVYCDFRIYDGVSNCKEFILRYGISTSGFYRLRMTSSEQPKYHYCSDVFTCKQLQERDEIETSGKYLLGSANNQYEVHCDFSGSDAITEIRHDSMNEVKMTNCEDRGCYSKIPRYTISLNYTIKIIENSRECRQYIKARCQGMALFRTNPYAWWVSRDGEKMMYWGGAISKINYYCACGETGQCADNVWKCNCDKNDGTIRADEGFLTAKTKLPVKEIRFGDMGNKGENGWHTLGKLECMG
ncbi:uncharacterized protein LOC120344349 [Styela clava]